MKQAVILAGGQGTRLAERLGGRPKALVAVGGVPLLERQILLLKREGYEQLVLLVNAGAQQIEAFCAGRNGWGLDIRCIDDGAPRGTAGAVLHAIDQLEPEFLVMYGDTMLEVDLNRFSAFHAADPDAAATLFVHPNDHPHDSDLVDVDWDGQVRGFHPYPHPQDVWLPNLVNAALYCVRREALRPWSHHAGMLDFGKDLFPAMLERGMRLRAYPSPEYIKDVGTPARIDRACADFESGRIARASLESAQKAVFLDRDGTINREVDHLSRAEQFELLPGVERAVQRLNRSEYRVCVLTNQAVVARGDCSMPELQRIHHKMETLLGRGGAYVDRIDFCPHHPESGHPGERPELKRACECRKPATGMIDAAAEALHIDRGQSWLIGDTSTDLLTAQRSGLRSILVQTGHAGLDHKVVCAPDYVAADLAAAVDFILDGHARLLQALAPIARTIGAGTVVFVGGHARSGKSTAASGLKELLRAAGHRCQILHTDDWLLGQSQRGTGVAGRHDMPGLHAMVSRLMGREAWVDLVLPAYLKSRRAQLPAAQTLSLAPDEIVIVEGVVALALGGRNPGSTRLFIEADEAQRHARLLHEYAVRGEAERAQSLYEQRRLDEWPWIEASAAGALRITLPEQGEVGVTP